MFTRRRSGRTPSRKLNPLSILALILLIALFLARRLISHAPPATNLAGAPSAAGLTNGSGEKLTPADRQSLDEVIRDKAHH